MRTLIDWWLTLDPTWTFLVLLPFGAAIAGLIVDLATRPGRAPRGRHQQPDRVPPTRPSTPPRGTRGQLRRMRARR